MISFVTLNDVCVKRYDPVSLSRQRWSRSHASRLFNILFWKRHVRGDVHKR